MTLRELLLFKSHFAQMVRQAVDSKNHRAYFIDSLGLCNIRRLAAIQSTFRRIFGVTANEQTALLCRSEGRGSIGGVRHGNRGSSAIRDMPFLD
jgi:hypothetical protein